MRSPVIPICHQSCFKAAVAGVGTEPSGASPWVCRRGYFAEAPESGRCPAVLPPLPGKAAGPPHLPAGAAAAQPETHFRSSRTALSSGPRRTH